MPCSRHDARSQKGEAFTTTLFWLTDEQMKRLKPFFPKSQGKPRVYNQRVLSSLIFIYCNRLRWCDALREHDPPNTRRRR